jgi:RHS repeat-associated protein
MDDKPVAMVDDTGASPAIYYIHTDQVNRPQKLTDVSDNIVWDGVFDPFGNVWSIAGSETMLLMFPGQYYDSETQLSQNWHRDYDPTIGRYVQSDPIGLWGGINTYAYVGNNPLRYLDPNGMAAEKPDCSKKDDCIERCSDLALPTSDYGTAFFRCMQTCMGTNPWPEWTKYFPDADSEPAPAPGQSNSQNAAAAAVGAAAGVAVSWATIEIIAAGLALAF